MSGIFGLPFDASVAGHEIDTLIHYLHYLMLALFVGWGIYYLYALYRFRQCKNPKADYHGAKTHVSTFLEIGVAAIEAVLLIAFSIPIYAKVVSKLPAEQDSVVVRVVAQQFNWNFQYPGADGKLGRLDPKLVDPLSNPNGLDAKDPNAQDDYFSATEMRIPSGKPVIVRVTSKDVIHNFAVPNLRVKQDAIPGMEFPVWFQAKTEGTYDIACSQLCGELHYSMKGDVIVQKPEEFAQWASSQTTEVANIQANSIV